jgi:glc operon protein GlcG
VTITLLQASEAIATALHTAEAMNIQISASVCDVGGHLGAFSRMDGASWATIYGAHGKAIASAATGAPSGRIPANLPVMQRINELTGDRMVYSQGAVPIVFDGQLIGAIGAGGGTAEQDEECAIAGAAVLDHQT